MRVVGPVAGAVAYFSPTVGCEGASPERNSAGTETAHGGCASTMIAETTHSNTL